MNFFLDKKKLNNLYKLLSKYVWIIKLLKKKKRKTVKIHEIKFNIYSLLFNLQSYIKY